jgi:hypothetical protein
MPGGGGGKPSSGRPRDSEHTGQGHPVSSQRRCRGPSPGPDVALHDPLESVTPTRYRARHDRTYVRPPDISRPGGRPHPLDRRARADRHPGGGGGGQAPGRPGAGPPPARRGPGRLRRRRPVTRRVGGGQARRLPRHRPDAGAGGPIDARPNPRRPGRGDDRVRAGGGRDPAPPGGGRRRAEGGLAPSRPPRRPSARRPAPAPRPPERAAGLRLSVRRHPARARRVQLAAARAAGGIRGEGGRGGAPPPDGCALRPRRPAAPGRLPLRPRPRLRLPGLAGSDTHRLGVRAGGDRDGRRRAGRRHRRRGRRRDRRRAPGGPRAPRRVACAPAGSR